MPECQAQYTLGAQPMGSAEPATPAEASARQPCWPALLPFSLPSPTCATHLLPFRYGRRSGLLQQRQGHACRQRSATDKDVRWQRLTAGRRQQTAADAAALHSSSSSSRLRKAADSRRQQPGAPRHAAQQVPLAGAATAGMHSSPHRRPSSHRALTAAAVLSHPLPLHCSAAGAGIYRPLPNYSCSGCRPTMVLAPSFRRHAVWFAKFELQARAARTAATEDAAGESCPPRHPEGLSTCRAASPTG